MSVKNTSDRFVSTVLESYGVSRAEFHSGGIFVHSFEEAPSLFRYPARKPGFRMVGFGTLVAIVASDEYLEIARSYTRSAQEWFGVSILNEIASIGRKYGQQLGAAHHKYVAQADQLSTMNLPDGYTCKQVEADEMESIYLHAPPSHNALTYGRKSHRSDIRAVTARHRSEIVGIAGASEDADGLFQIGVDVVEEHRRRGIGTHIVSKLAESILEGGGVPFYTATTSNIASQRLCISAGFRPVCVELYAHV
jgi:predicted GNAT family acetyltransferase